MQSKSSQKVITGNQKNVTSISQKFSKIKGIRYVKREKMNFRFSHPLLLRSLKAFKIKAFRLFYFLRISTYTAYLTVCKITINFYLVFSTFFQLISHQWKISAFSFQLSLIYSECILSRSFEYTCSTNHGSVDLFRASSGVNQDTPLFSSGFMETASSESASRR